MEQLAKTLAAVVSALVAAFQQGCALLLALRRLYSLMALKLSFMSARQHLHYFLLAFYNSSLRLRKSAFKFFEMPAFKSFYHILFAGCLVSFFLLVVIE
jgi:hypothetical protein